MTDTEEYVANKSNLRANGEIKDTLVLGRDTYRRHGNEHHAFFNQEDNDHSNKVNLFEHTNDGDVTENMNTHENYRRLAAVNTFSMEKNIDINNGIFSGQTLSSTSLGNCYSSKINQLSSAKFIVPDIDLTDREVEDLYITTKISSSHTITDFLSAQEYTNNLIKISGGIEVNYKMIEVMGKALFQNTFQQDKNSISLYQVGFSYYETEEFDQNELQQHAKTLKYIHVNARDKAKLDKYILDHGEYYVTKIVKGRKAVRRVTFNFANEEDKLEIGAELDGKFDLKTLSVKFWAKFNLTNEESKQYMGIQYDSAQIGGDKSKLDSIDFASKDFATIERDFHTTWLDYFDDEHTDNLEVLRADLSRISSSIHEGFSRSPDEAAILHKRIEKARNRISELEEQKVEISLALARSDFIVQSLSSSSQGAKRALLTPIINMKNAFEEYHMEVVIEKFEKYLTSNDTYIMDNYTPPEGSASRLDSQTVDIYNRTEGWLKTVKLDNTQMDQIYFMLSGHSLIERKISGQNMLFDGAVALGVPAGVPNEVLFYYDNEDLLIENGIRTPSWVFKVLGDQWDPLERKMIANSYPVLNDHYIKADKVDFDKLPSWLSDKLYKSKVEFDPPGIEYEGYWKKGNFFGHGVLTNIGKTSDSSETSFVSCEITWKRQSMIHYTQKLIFDYDDFTVFYFGDVLYNKSSMDVIMHGQGTLNFGGNSTVGHWENGQVIVSTLNEFSQLNPFLLQSHRYKPSKHFEYSFNNSDVDKYIGAVKIIQGDTLQVLRDGNGTIKYKNGQENRGTWKEDKILVRNQAEYNALHSFLKDNYLYKVVGNERIYLDNDLQDCKNEKVEILHNLTTCEADKDEIESEIVDINTQKGEILNTLTTCESDKDEIESELESIQTEFTLTRVCYYLQFTTLNGVWDASSNNFEIDGFGSVPRSCHTSLGNSCDLQVCNVPSLVIHHLDETDGWGFTITGDIESAASNRQWLKGDDGIPKLEFSLTRVCYYLQLTTLNGRWDASSSNFEIDGFGSVPRSCHTNPGDSCNLQVCNVPSLVIHDLSGPDGWRFTITGDIESATSSNKWLKGDDGIPKLEFSLIAN